MSAMRSFRRAIKARLNSALFAIMSVVTINPMLRYRNRTLRHFVFEAIRWTGYEGFLITTGNGNGNGTVLVHDSRDRGPGRDLFIRGVQDFSKLETALRLLQETRRLDRLLDVGANIGTICIPAVQQGLVRSAIAVEAVPDIVRLLRANIILNNLENAISVVAKAVSARAGETISVAVNNANFGDNRVVSAGTMGAERFVREIAITTTTIDDLLPDGAAATLIWMDIQGYEGIALQGATRALAALPPLVLEFCPALMRETGSYAALVAAIAGYRGFHDLSQPAGLQPLAELDTLRDRLGYRGNFTDILVV